MTPKPRKRQRIDKSVLVFGEPRRVRDRKYLDSYRDASCWNCGGVHGVVGAHIRAGNTGGTSLKPSDDTTVPLCFDCHQDQERNPGPLWWLEMVKNMARRRFNNWIEARNG